MYSNDSVVYNILRLVVRCLEACRNSIERNYLNAEVRNDAVNTIITLRAITLENVNCLTITREGAVLRLS